MWRLGSMIGWRATVKTNSWDIALQVRSVSRPHARFESTGAGAKLTDMGSANGTLLNGQLMTAPAVLKDGDVIIIGETVLIYRVA